jgi:hypothetical protein
MERILGMFGKVKDKEPPTIPVEMTEASKKFLKKMLVRPNPTLAEFMFFGLGTGNVVDQILVADEKKYLSHGLVQKNAYSYISSVHVNEFTILLEKLKSSGRMDHVMVVGHTHPSGEFVQGRYLYKLAPDSSLLIPSMGSENRGGPTSAHDLKFAVDIVNKLTMFPHPFFGIAAETEEGHKLRIYNTLDLASIKKRKEIDTILQATISL